MSPFPDEMPAGTRVRDWPCLVPLAALSTRLDVLRRSGLPTERAISTACRDAGVPPDHWAVDAALAIGLRSYRLAPDLLVGPDLFLRFASVATMSALGPRLLRLARAQADGAADH